MPSGSAIVECQWGSWFYGVILYSLNSKDFVNPIELSLRSSSFSFSTKILK